MMTLLIILFVTSAALLTIKIEKNRAIAQKYNYKIYALRDKLREKLIDNEIEDSDWTFDYLDKSLSKVIKMLRFISIYHVGYFSFVYRDDQRKKDLMRHLKKSFQRNPVFEEIYSEYGTILIGYFAERHRTTLRVVKVLALFSKFAKDLRRKIEKYILDIRDIPETSDYSYAK